MLEKINAVEECIGNPTYRIETNTDVLHGDIKNRLISFLTLPLRMLNAGYTYTGLLGLVNQDIGWLPVYLAHEYLVIARALYDIKRMHYYTIRRCGVDAICSQQCHMKCLEATSRNKAGANHL
ncbi:hypothetical protein SeMB42_g07355 [Synchytrium endobioticum]|uniref:Uncharacterized protein n=1 Tax=Synchytrium endobioticum TaxID=286115 RepID=A0A507C4E2_9FUNG|nr:hypothetical protein SeMB42_g07355 [Synchytrium endobioticum]